MVAIHRRGATNVFEADPVDGCGYTAGSRRTGRRAHAMASVMNPPKNPTEATFTAPEREYIRRELDQFFGTLPTAADGFQLKTWRGGAQKGQPKLPPPGRTLIERGLMQLDETARLPRLRFTETGVAALRLMMADRRFTDPVKFAHIRRELGIEPSSDSEAAE